VINKCRNGDDEVEMEEDVELGELSLGEEEEEEGAEDKKKKVAKLSKYILPVFLKVLLHTDR
jgi:hypothetical protein